MNNSVLQKAQELLAHGVPFALATVVRRERPTSGAPGDKAIITGEGKFIGWVGGSCAQPTVLKEAQKALADGEPRLVVLTPRHQEESREGIELYEMSCYSGGVMEIYVEPYLPEPELLVCGDSPAAEALVKIGKAVGFKIVVVDPSATKERFGDADVVRAQMDPGELGRGRERFAVVATMGNWDEEALKAVLELSPDYVGFIASKKRFQETLARLGEDGVARAKLDSIRCPAGLNISARTFQEVALSIMAEIVSIRRRRTQTALQGDSESKALRQVKDPVCHMAVDPQTARHSCDFQGATYYFCNLHCQKSFEKHPRKYLSMEAQA